MELDFNMNITPLKRRRKDIGCGRGQMHAPGSGKSADLKGDHEVVDLHHPNHDEAS